MDNKYIEQLRTQVKDALRTDNMPISSIHLVLLIQVPGLAMCHGADMNKACIAGSSYALCQMCS